MLLVQALLTFATYTIMHMVKWHTSTFKTVLTCLMSDFMTIQLEKEWNNMAFGEALEEKAWSKLGHAIGHQFQAHQLCQMALKNTQYWIFCVQLCLVVDYFLRVLLLFNWLDCFLPLLTTGSRDIPTVKSDLIQFWKWKVWQWFSTGDLSCT